MLKRVGINRPGSSWLSHHSKAMSVWRMVLVCMFTFLINGYATAKAQGKVSVSVQAGSLASVLSTVEKQTGYSFFFDEKILASAKPVNVNAKEMELDKFLELLFKDQPFRFSVRNRVITISPKNQATLATDTPEQAAATTVSGKVINGTGQPVIGATIRLKPSGMGTSTNERGVFVINNVPSGTYTIEISCIGFTHTSEKIAVNSQPVELLFTMKERVIEQKEVVIATGYTSKKTGEMTGAVQRISGDDLRTGITSSDPASLLKGRVAGVYISEQNAADPTSSGGQLFVRGQSSIAGVGLDQVNEFVIPTLSYGPLLVLDGVIMPNQNLKDLVTPQEIQEITILKDAAATAIYGSRAAAGVMVVTTKKGRTENTRISADIKHGVNIPNTGNMHFMSGQELYDLQQKFYTENYAQNNASLSPIFPTLPEYLTYMLPTQEAVANSYDWTKYAFRTSHTTDVNISASGGNDKTKFYIGASYYKEDATSVLNSLTRKTFRLNLDTRLTDRLSTSMSINGILNNGYRDMNSVAGAVQTFIPWSNPYNSAGALTPALQYKMGGNQQVKGNPLYDNQFNYYNLQSQLFFGSIKLDYRITDWLSISSTNSGNLNYNKNVQYIDVRTYDGGTSIFAPQGYLGTTTGNLMSYLTSNQLSFNKRAGEHSIRALAALEFGQTTNENMLVNVNHVRAGYPVISLAREMGGPADLSFFGIPSTKVGNLEGGKDVRAVYSVFGEAGYTYKSRYSLSGSIRTDASSSFGSNNRYGTFYSGGAAWNISSEPFLEQMKWLSMLKLRANYGTSGSQLGDNFLTRTLYDPREVYSGSGAATITVLGNPDLRWEITKTFSTGVDMDLWNRFSANIDFYRRRSQDLIQKVTLPPMAGFPTQWQNAAVVQNTGVEVVLNSQNIMRKNFTWSTAFNFSWNKNQIVSVANDSLRQGYYDQNSFYLYKGDDINTLKAVKYAGVDPQTGKPLFEKLLFDAKGQKTGVEYVNTLAEVGADRDSRQFQTVGSFQPRFYGGLTNTFSYNNISLSVLITYAIKYTMTNNYAAAGQMANIGRFNQLKYTKAQIPWTTPGQTNATEPSLYYQGTTTYFGSDKYMHDASNASLRNIRLSYELPKAFIDRLKLANCTVYASADNLYTLYSKKIIASSPEGPAVGEAQDFGNSGGVLGIPRRFMIGAQLSF
ncbi:TonB-linked outer membrane protein, SusC/RagA family [Chitinophaga jiangningensis]|uniref:TonB-linked outer membrane protein, SusC/RagA family n=1 Tax=Chitinophaga jiangningensis TaxID=1419482 RepID=A0A1M7LRU9_9BACT|nr:SusC/RagA family TonB-linked outer membrane protein [Chitinophaga jiangningensis]SHM81006.1 TonB-linked outer membrane protein, SusC/RagA family [Chitinophaga jiangningensis]